MAYPTVNDWTSSIEAENTLSHIVSLPTTVNAGELIIIFFSTDGDNVSTFPDEGVTWIKLLNLNDSKDIHLSVAYKIAVGNEGGTTITVTTSSNETSAHLSYTITGHNSSTNAPEISTGVTGASDSPDPGSLTATFGADDNLWFAISANDDDDSITNWPTNYADNQHQLEAGGTGPTLGVCTYNYNGGDTQDPGVFTLAASEQWAAATLVVQAGPEPAEVFTPQIMVTSIFT